MDQEIIRHRNVIKLKDAYSTFYLQPYKSGLQTCKGDRKDHSETNKILSLKRVYFIGLNFMEIFIRFRLMT